MENQLVVTNRERERGGGARYGYGIKRYKLLVINDKDV